MRLLYWLGIKKKHTGFRFWKGLALIREDDGFKWEEFEINLEDPITDPYFLQYEYQLKCPFTHPNGFVVYDVMIPNKNFWTMTFTVNPNV